MIAEWSANSDIPYKVVYYLQNIENDEYSLATSLTENLMGTTDASVSIKPKTIEHFEYNSTLSNTSGDIAVDGSLELKLYYTRNSYNITAKGNNAKAGTIVQNIDGSYRYGAEITLNAIWGSPAGLVNSLALGICSNFFVNKMLIIVPLSSMKSRPNEKSL